MSNNRPFTYQTIPDELRQLHQWVLWRKVWRDDKGKFDKIPTQVNGYPASITNRNHFSPFDVALFAYENGIADGLGFCFLPENNLIFVDLDGAVNCVGWDKDKLPILQAFPTWGELSQSEKGVHLIAKGKLDRAHVYHPGGLELYSSGRFCAMTGWQLEGWPTHIAELQPAVDQLAAHIDTLRGTLGDRILQEAGPMPPLCDFPDIVQLSISEDVYRFLTTGEAGKWDNDRSRALFAASASLYRAGLKDAEVLSCLWHYAGHIAAEHRTQGDPRAWLWKYSVAPTRGAARPDPDALFDAIPTAPVDQLAGLMARVNAIKDADRMTAEGIHAARTLLLEARSLDAGSRVALHQALKARMKWTKEQFDAVQSEINQNARRLQQGGADSMDAVWPEYIYVAKQHAFLRKSSNEFLKPEAFISKYIHLDPDMRDKVLMGGGVTKVMGVDFDPCQPAFFQANGATYYNTWRGLADIGLPGDVVPWLNHVRMLIPDDAQRAHLLDWMAFTLQHPEVKINHCIVLAGKPGIGKDTLFFPLSQALGRHHKEVGADALMRDFNDFLVEAKLVTIQEADIGNRKEASMVANRMKPLIASPPNTLYVNPKGVAAYAIQNVVHLILQTNEAHPAMIHDGDRRYFVISSDLIVCGQDGNQLPEFREYFRNFWAWMDGGGGWRYVVAWLLARDVSSFNPKAPPPMTEAKQDIIEAGRSPLEAMLRAAIGARIGPFVDDTVESAVVHAWLMIDGSALLAQYGLREVPSVRAIGNALTALGATGTRYRREGVQVRALNVARLRAAPALESDALDWLN